MKFVSIVFSSLLGVLPLQASTATEQVHSKTEWTQSSDWVSDVQQDYQAEKYNEFLSDLSKEYQKELKSGELKPSSKLTKEQYEMFENSEVQKKALSYQEEIQKLQESRNQELQKIAKAHSEDPISKTIKEALQGSEEMAQEKKNHQRRAKLMQTSQDPASQEIYNVLEEYRAKKLILAKRGILNSRIYTENTGLDDLVLGLSARDQLLAVCDKYPNNTLAEEYRSSALAYTKHASYQKNEKHLKALATGGVKAHSVAEKQVAKVMKNFETQKQKISEKYASM